MPIEAGFNFLFLAVNCIFQYLSTSFTELHEFHLAYRLSDSKYVKTTITMSLLRLLNFMSDFFLSFSLFRAVLRVLIK